MSILVPFTTALALLGNTSWASSVDVPSSGDEAVEQASSARSKTKAARGNRSSSNNRAARPANSNRNARHAPPPSSSSSRGNSARSNSAARPSRPSTTRRAAAPVRAHSPRNSSSARSPSANNSGHRTHVTNRNNSPRTTTGHKRANNGPVAAHKRANNGPVAANKVRHTAAHRNHHNAIRTAKHRAHHPALKAQRVKANRIAHAKHMANHRTHRRYVFPRWRPSWHRYHLRSHHPHWHPAYWSRGIFIYSPPPRRSVVVVDGQEQTVDTGRGSLRAVDRNGDLGIGIRSGTYMSSYYDGYGAFGDFGMGFALRYRPVESLGLEAAYQYHNESWNDESERTSQPFSTSVQLYAFPWTRVSPYLTAGLTWTARNYSDTFHNGISYDQVYRQDTLFGPHGGLGLEFAVGQSASINVEGRYVGYVNVADNDPSTPGALQGTAGLNFYF